MRIRALILALAFSPAALGQDALPGAPRGDLGVRYWPSTGETKRSHNAQSVAPGLGNPTSVLLYENLDANALELFGRQDFAEDWFLKGFLGYGRVNRGSFDDEDFLAGQVKFSDTTSSVTQGRLGYGTLDAGRQWVMREGAVVLGAFAGYGQWTESVDAYGATDHLGFIGGDVGRDVKVISNKVIWRVLRVGFAGRFAFGRRTRLSLDLAAIPYGRVRNEDSHHLRTDPSDLGPAPNIIGEGKALGLQADAELSHEIFRRTELGVGWRYWYLEARDARRSLPNRPDVPELPLVELYSVRTGLTVSLRRTW